MASPGGVSLVPGGALNSRILSCHSVISLHVLPYAPSKYVARCPTDILRPIYKSRKCVLVQVSNRKIPVSNLRKTSQYTHRPAASNLPGLLHSLVSMLFGVPDIIQVYKKVCSCTQLYPLTRTTSTWPCGPRNTRQDSYGAINKKGGHWCCVDML